MTPLQDSVRLGSTDLLACGVCRPSGRASRYQSQTPKRAKASIGDCKDASAAFVAGGLRRSYIILGTEMSAGVNVPLCVTKSEPFGEAGFISAIIGLGTGRLHLGPGPFY